MLLRHKATEDVYAGLAEKIREDLLTTFQNKGISISKIQIDMKSDNLNVSVCINEK